MGPQAIVFEPLSAAASAPTGPYAPSRSLNASQYSWQSATPAKCAARTPTKVEGSVGAFPLLSAAEEASLAAQLGSTEPARAPADAVVASLRPAFRQCFSRFLETKANAEGSVRFALEVGCSGEVQAIAADVKGVDEATVSCLFRIVGPARFEPPAGGHATLQVPVVFKNATRAADVR